MVVLTNNDGCIIARSPEAKALGFKMAEPEFQARARLKRHGVAVFSSNYALYGDLSARVMATLSMFTPEKEISSIDKAFLNLTGLQEDVRGMPRISAKPWASGRASRYPSASGRPRPWPRPPTSWPRSARSSRACWI